MKVLHLSYNVASQISVSVRALRAIGVQARGLIIPSQGDFIQSHDYLEILPDAPGHPWSMPWIRHRTHHYAAFLTAIAWADVLHWHYGHLALGRGLDLRWARLLRRAGVAEFWGSDIRIGSVEAADNPYFAAHAPPEYRAQQTLQRSIETQAPFARAGFSCLVPDGAMLSYVQRNLFPAIHLVRQRVFVADYAPCPPDPHKRPLIVHSPSDPKLKGSEFVLAAVEKLRADHDFDFRLIQGVPRAEALAVLGEADIFVDQLILGSHGLASIEAMALAKPVICYIKPPLLSTYPSDLPIVNANPETITEVLRGLITNGRRRYELGVQGRAYAERYHDAVVIAGGLRDIYRGLPERS